MSRVRAFNERLALRITSVVGTMACAWAFTGLALVSLPGVLGFTWLPQRTVLIVAWVAQTFLQLVLLSVIMVGQNIQSARVDAHVEHHETTHSKLDAIANHLGVGDA